MPCFSEGSPQGSPQGSLGNPGFLCFLVFLYFFDFMLFFGLLMYFSDFLSNINVFNENNVIFELLQQK